MEFLFLLGFGMNAYFDTLKYLMQMMIFITIFTIPTMSIYAKYGAVKQESLDPFTVLSLGNMGIFNLILYTYRWS